MPPAPRLAPVQLEPDPHLGAAQHRRADPYVAARGLGEPAHDVQAEAGRAVAAGAAPCTVDVRSKAEFEQGHVPGAVHIPFWQMATRWRELAVARESAVVVYCGHGPRAYIAGSVLKRLGFTRVMYLAGHMKKWKALDLPLERH